LDVIIELTPEEAACLETIASQEGLDASEYAGRLVRRHLPLPSSAQPDGEDDPLAAAIARMTNRSPEEKAAARERTLATYQPRRPLPPGKTFSEVIAGQWPGSETDAQVYAALEDLS
jgi:hypothetical protein